MSSTSYTLSSGQSFLFSIIEAEVVNNERSESVSIHSSGGGGYVGQYGGYVQAPTIHSTTTSNQRIWLRLQNGSEHHLDLENADLPTRTGHQLRLQYVSQDGGENTRLTAVHNITTSRYLDYTERAFPLMDTSRGWKTTPIAVLLMWIGLLSACYFGYSQFNAAIEADRVLIPLTPDCPRYGAQQEWGESKSQYAARLQQRKECFDTLAQRVNLVNKQKDVAKKIKEDLIAEAEAAAPRKWWALMAFVVGFVWWGSRRRSYAIKLENEWRRVLRSFISKGDPAAS